MKWTDYALDTLALLLALGVLYGFLVFGALIEQVPA